jgi:hypothetical protein
VDANFSAEHVHIKYPERDVSLSDGLGYMVQWSNYKKHLDISKETREVWLEVYMLLYYTD